MSLIALVCPRCAAPLTAGPPAVTKCTYCDATLVDQAAPGTLRLVTVWLDDAGPEKIAVIQAVFKIMRNGLADARDLVNTAPCALATGIAESQGHMLVADLRKLGATVRIGPA
jgi:ribosomal protein L7/L12